MATFVDITERRRTEDALRASEANLKQEMRLVELSRSPIFTWDFDDGILKWNRGSEELYGYTREEAIGHTSRELNMWVDPAQRDELIGRVLANGEVRD